MRSEKAHQKDKDKEKKSLTFLSIQYISLFQLKLTYAKGCCMEIEF